MTLQVIQQGASPGFASFTRLFANQRFMDPLSKLGQVLETDTGGEVVVAGDGQVSLGQTVIKGTARKVRRLSPGGRDVVWAYPVTVAETPHWMAFSTGERLNAA